MACIRVEVNKVDYKSLSDTHIEVGLLREPLRATITKKDGIRVAVTLIPKSTNELIRQKINCLITRADNAIQCILSDVVRHPVVKVGIICSINNIPTPMPGITFKYDTLTWDEYENYAGATKYNLLTASGVWELEELL